MNPSRQILTQSPRLLRCQSRLVAGSGAVRRRWLSDSATEATKTTTTTNATSPVFQSKVGGMLKQKTAADAAAAAATAAEPPKPKAPGTTTNTTPTATTTSTSTPKPVEATPAKSTPASAAKPVRAAKPAAPTTVARSKPAPKPLPVAAKPAPAVKGSSLPVSCRYDAKSVAYGDADADAARRDSVIPEVDWSASFHGVSSRPVTAAQFEALMRPLEVADIEVKPDGIIYLPEIRYRRRLNEAFGPMGWGLVPKGEAVVGQSVVTREYALVVDGRFVSQAQGENNFFGNDGLPSAVEGCKSNALMRCCKDLGIASELWDPAYIRWFKKTHMEEIWVEHATTKKRRKQWYRKGEVDIVFPYQMPKSSS